MAFLVELSGRQRLDFQAALHAQRLSVALRRQGDASRAMKKLGEPIEGPTMLSLLIHGGLGALTVLAFFYVNAHLYRSEWPGSHLTFLERLYYITAVVSVCIGWFRSAGRCSSPPARECAYEIIEEEGCERGDLNPHGCYPTGS